MHWSFHWSLHTRIPTLKTAGDFTAGGLCLDPVLFFIFFKEYKQMKFFAIIAFFSLFAVARSQASLLLWLTWT